MRIGIDAHIILPKHKRYDPKIARYTEQLIQNLVEADSQKEHTWVLFFDSRMKGTSKMKQFEELFEKHYGNGWGKHVIVRHFPFVHYRKYLPVVYSHMMVSSFLTAARLDVFHSPEGLVPFMYPGKIITTFHYVPKGESESNLFVRTFMLGARAAFRQLCRRATRIIVSKRSDKKLLEEKHGYPAERVIVMEEEDIERVDWPRRVRQLLAVYLEVGKPKPKKPSRREKAAASSSKKK